MLVPLETLLDGVVRALTESVAPDVGTRYARGQLFAAVDVLRNLRERIEEKAALQRLETESAEAALGAVIAALGDEARAVVAALAEAPAEPTAARLTGLRVALVRTLAVVDALPPALAAAVRPALEEHLASQALRDVAVLKPSLLAEISRG